MNILEDWAVELSENNADDEELCSAIEDIIMELSLAGGKETAQERTKIFKDILAECENVKTLL